MESPEGRSGHARHWTLDPAVAYLNHGSFGATPRAVLDHQSALRERMEREPVDFLDRELPGRLAECRQAVGSFVGADPEGLAFASNATTAVNAALRSLDVGDGDELLTTDHAYGACRKALEFVARRRRARVVVARVPFPTSGPDEIVEAVLAAVTPRTRLALLDHVTSPTAIVFPIERLVAELRSRGIDSVVDGAHALGMVPLRLEAMEAAVYTANAHKWLCAPKGAAIVHVRRDLRRTVRPLVVSHGFDPADGGVRFREEWDWTGTGDPTAWLSIPESIRFLESLLPGGWPALMERNRALAREGRDRLAAALGVAPPCPDAMLGAMASLFLPAPAAGSATFGLGSEALSAWTRGRGIESWFFAWSGEGRTILRISAQLYNDRSQYEALASLLLEGTRA